MDQSQINRLVAGLLLLALIAAVPSNASEACDLANCASCSADPEGGCETCMTGFAPSEGECSACPQGCLSCVNSGLHGCDTCLAGQGMTSGSNSTTDCTDCDALNCAECYANHEVCENCTRGFVLLQGQCVACPMDCPSCNNAGPSTCDTCRTGQGLTSPGGSPSTDCANCAVTNCGECYADKQVCEVCAAGFFLSGGECIECFTDCSSCTNAGMGGCDRCFAGKGWAYGQDSSIPICTSCTVENCAECFEGYGVCEVCAAGFVLSDRLCPACADNCPSCNKAGSGGCDTCVTGQGLTTTEGNPSADCASCVVENCSECYANNQVCEKCRIGFDLTEGQCIHLE